jgi:hypothetical protein
LTSPCFPVDPRWDGGRINPQASLGLLGVLLQSFKYRVTGRILPIPPAPALLHEFLIDVGAIRLMHISKGAPADLGVFLGRNSPTLGVCGTPHSIRRTVRGPLCILRGTGLLYLCTKAIPMTKPILFHDIDGMLYGYYAGMFQLRPRVKTWLEWASARFEILWVTTWDEKKIKALLSAVSCEKYLKHLVQPAGFGEPTGRPQEARQSGSLRSPASKAWSGCGSMTACLTRGNCRCLASTPPAAWLLILTGWTPSKTSDSESQTVSSSGKAALHSPLLPQNLVLQNSNWDGSRSRKEAIQ